jgi:hypothetical protein
MTDVCLFESQYSESSPLESSPLGSRLGLAHVYLSILESLLQIVIDSFIRDLTDQSKIRNPHFLLLCGIESGLLDIRLAAARRSSSSTPILGFLGLLALRSSTDPLLQSWISYRTRREDYTTYDHLP